jgi:hypothetical protein
MTDPTEPGAAEREAFLDLSSVAGNVRAALALDVAAGLDLAERVVLALDTRDPNARELAATLHTSSERFDTFLAQRTEALGAIGRFTEAHADEGRVPTIISPVYRGAVVAQLAAVDTEVARQLAEASGAVVLAVSAGGFTVRQLETP